MEMDRREKGGKGGGKREEGEKQGRVRKGKERDGWLKNVGKGDSTQRRSNITHTLRSCFSNIDPSSVLIPSQDTVTDDVIPDNVMPDDVTTSDVVPDDVISDDVIDTLGGGRDI